MKKLSDYRKETITVKDKFTGFEGTVTGHCDYITGCDQYLVQPQTKEGEWKDARWFDENRLELIGTSASLITSKGEAVNDNGADIAAPVK